MAVERYHMGRPVSAIEIDSPQRQPFHIRLLVIKAAKESDNALVCCLEHATLGQCPPFAALSYVWGDPSLQSESILLNGNPFNIGANLAAALRFFRDEFKTSAKLDCEPPRHLWVDALCINQGDNDEKAAQVNQMDQIYKSAVMVVAHLGLGDDLARRGVPIIQALSQTWRRIEGESIREETSVEEPEVVFPPPRKFIDESKVVGLLLDLASALEDNAWRSVKAYMDMPYWSRIWIIQEVVLGREVVLALRGAPTICWDDIRDAMLFTTKIPIMLENFRSFNSQFWSPFADFVKVPWTHVQLIWQYKGAKIGRGYIAMNSRMLLSSTLNILFRTSSYLATDARDKIFGLRGICELPVEPQYDCPVEEVYIKFAMGCVLDLHFNIMQGAGIGLDVPRNPKLPSWVPDWQRNWRSPLIPELYEASGWLDPFPGEAPKTEFGSGFALKIRGAFCDTIASIWPKTVLKSKDLFDMVCSFRTSTGTQQTPLYRTGVPIMQALLQTFALGHSLGSFDPTYDFDKGDFDDVLCAVLSFVSFLIPEEASEDKAGKQLENSMTKLGLDPNF